MRAALYLRVSTRDSSQYVDNQHSQSRQYCASREWEIVEEYEDQDSGGKANRVAFPGYAP
jgi:DNA invertase Pin-like site-specific DNA recombinase